MESVTGLAVFVSMVIVSLVDSFSMDNNDLIDNYVRFAIFGAPQKLARLDSMFRDSMFRDSIEIARFSRRSLPVVKKTAKYHDEKPTIASRAPAFRGPSTTGGSMQSRWCLSLLIDS